MTTDQAYGSIRKRLTSLRNHFLGLEISVFLLRLLAWGIALLVVNVLISFLPIPPTAARALLYISLALLTGVAVFHGMLLVRRWPTLDSIAAEAERVTPELDGDLLRGALDVWRKRKGSVLGYSPGLIDALVESALLKSEAIRERSVVGRRRFYRHLFILPAAALAVAFLFLVVPARTALVIRSVAPLDPEAAIAAFGLHVEPGDCTVRAGEAVKVTALFDAYDGEAVRLAVKRPGSSWTAYPMGETTAGTARRFEGTVADVEEGTEYSIHFAGGESDVYTITVSTPPVVTGLAYDLLYPGYTGLEKRRVEENHGNVRALFGTTVNLEITANEPLSEASIRVDGGKEIALAVDGDRCTGSFGVTEPFSYTLHIVGKRGFENVDPIRYEVIPVPDENPFVRISSPAEDRVLDESMVLPIRFAALDDYGVREVNLLFSRNGEPPEKLPFFKTEKSVTEIDREREWDLSEERLLPQDVVSYFLEVWDNDPLNGPKRSVSRTWTVRMPSLSQMYAEVKDDQEENIGELEGVRERSEKLEEKLDDLAREIRKAENVSWDDKKKIESVLEKQKEIEKQLRDVAKELDRSAREMEENRLVTPETLERLQELNQLLQEVATDEMKKAMKELAEAMEKMDPGEIEKAAQELQLTQQDFMERLDRSIDMLKEMKDMQTLDALAEGMRRVAEEQRKLREETRKADGGEMKELSKEQDALRKELDKLEEQMKKLAEESAERSPEFSEEVKKTSNRLEQKKTASKMNKASEKMQQQKKNEAMKKQEEAEQDLFDIAFKLVDFRKACQMASQKKTKAAFGESIRDLLHISDGQESLLDRAKGRRRPSVTERRSLAEIQQEMDGGIGKAMGKIRDVAKDAPELSSLILDLLRRTRMKAEEAAEQYETGDLNLARARGKEVLADLNHSVVQLLRSQENYNSSCSNPDGQGQSGQQLQEMTRRQQGLNQEMGQMPIPSGNPGDLSSQTMAGMKRLAAEQRAIRKGIEELSGEVEESSDVLGSLDEIAEEMRDVERALENADISPETREKQERILSRMLDAQRSIRERGYKRERRSRSGGEFEAAAPADLPGSLSESREKIRDDLVRMPNFEYPPEYEELIRSYFRTLTK